MVTDKLNGLFFKTNKDYENIIFNLYENRQKLKWYDKQARIQSEHYSSKNYADRVLEVYNRAIKEKKLEYRFGFISKLYQTIKRRFQ